MQQAGVSKTIGATCLAQASLMRSDDVSDFEKNDVLASHASLSALGKLANQLFVAGHELVQSSCRSFVRGDLYRTLAILGCVRRDGTADVFGRGRRSGHEFHGSRDPSAAPEKPENLSDSG
jgi:hypothetical protein